MAISDFLCRPAPPQASALEQKQMCSAVLEFWIGLQWKWGTRFWFPHLNANLCHIAAKVKFKKASHHWHQKANTRIEESYLGSLRLCWELLFYNWLWSVIYLSVFGACRMAGNKAPSRIRFAWHTRRQPNLSDASQGFCMFLECGQEAASSKSEFWPESPSKEPQFIVADSWGINTSSLCLSLNSE